MIPDHWTIVPLETLATYKAGRTPARDNTRFWEGDSDRLPWVSIADMENYGLVTQTKETITRDAFDQVFRSHIVRAGTLLMSFKLTIGRVATLGIDACHNEAIISIYPKRAVDQRFLSYFLSQVDYENHQDRQIKGNTLNQDKINRIPVTLPPPHEQSAIADVLDCVRAGIDIQARADSTARELKCAAMRELFTRGLRGEAQKETEIGLVPESWSVGKLGNFAHFQRGFDITKTAQVAGTIPVVSSGGVKSYHNEAAVKRPGVLIGRKGTIGSLHYVDNDFWPHDTTLWCKDFRGNCPKFVFYRLHRLNLKKLDSGATNPALNRNFLHDEIISWPQVDEQHEIVAILDAIDRKIDLHRRKRVVLEELFKSLLHKLMTGAIRVADLDLSAPKPAEKPEAAE